MLNLKHTQITRMPTAKNLGELTDLTAITPS